MPLGQEIVINAIAAISETPEHLARIFLTREHRAAAELILEWMREANMRAHLDAAMSVGEQIFANQLELGSTLCRKATSECRRRTPPQDIPIFQRTKFTWS
jgi:hypothetical protein